MPWAHNRKGDDLVFPLIGLLSEAAENLVAALR
jgi:hypothetical protein